MDDQSLTESYDQDQGSINQDSEGTSKSSEASSSSHHDSEEDYGDGWSMPPVNPRIELSKMITSIMNDLDNLKLSVYNTRQYMKDAMTDMSDKLTTQIESIFLRVLRDHVKSLENYSHAAKHEAEQDAGTGYTEPSKSYEKDDEEEEDYTEGIEDDAEEADGLYEEDEDEEEEEDQKEADDLYRRQKNAERKRELHTLDNYRPSKTGLKYHSAQESKSEASSHIHVRPHRVASLPPRQFDMFGDTGLKLDQRFSHGRQSPLKYGQAYKKPEAMREYHFHIHEH